ncbi:murein L,D-transpeptidase catalytic domain family protein [Echinicola sediminis]
MLLLLCSTALFSFFPKNGEKSSTPSEAASLYQKLSEHLALLPASPQEEALQMAVNGYVKLVNGGSIKPNKPLTIIDFTLPSTQKRLWTIDTQNGDVLHHTWVAHGRNSGNLLAKKFSNTPSSYMSSLGFYVTAETYHGKHGYSLRLDGVEKGFNDNARNRAIVMHGAQYANPSFIKNAGRLGRSLGCPALPMAEHKDIIKTIKEQSCLFIYADDATYKQKSPLINSKPSPL